MICPNGCNNFVGRHEFPVELIPGNAKGYYDCPKDKKTYYITEYEYPKTSELLNGKVRKQNGKRNKTTRNKSRR